MTWQPGQSGNPGGIQKDKPFQQALRMEAIALANGERIKHPRGSLRAIAQALLTKASDGDVPAAREVGDRLDGRPPQAVVGDSEAPIAITVQRGEEARQYISEQLARIAARQVIEAEALESGDQGSGGE